MGVGALVGGLFGLAGAAVTAHSAQKTQAANAAAQSDINQATMDFNAREAAKARDFTAAQSDIDRSFNEQQSLIQREWTERLANSAHQREVADLRAAGLNPILSSNYQGSATPSVPVASHTTPGSVAASVSGMSAYQRKNIMSEFVSSAREALRLELDYEKAKIQDKQADASHKQADASLKSADAAMKNAETNAKGQAAQEAKIKAEIDSINNSISIALEDLDIRKELKNASVEEKHAMIDKLMSDIDVNREQAAKIGIEKEELERRIRYGTFLSSYLPLEAREIVGNHMIDFVRENKGAIDFFMNNMNGNYELSSDDKAKQLTDKVLDWCIKKGYITNKLGK